MREAGYFYVPLASTIRLSVTVLPLCLNGDVSINVSCLTFIDYSLNFSSYLTENTFRVIWKEQSSDDMKAQRGGGGGVVLYLYFSFNLALDRGRVVNATSRPLYTRERDPVPIVQEDGWAPGPLVR
jgi:hypothetical protein